MIESAERRWEPHTCAGCKTHFEVGYREPREGTALAAAEISCPECGKHKTVSIPKGAEKDLRVQREGEDVDEGAGD